MTEELPLYFIADENWRPVPAVDLAHWGEWFADLRNRLIAEEWINGVRISTIFLGIPHCSNEIPGMDFGYFFETMAFGPTDLLQQLRDSVHGEHGSIFSWFTGGTDFQRRYKTVEDARDGHAETVALVRKAFADRN